MKPVTNVVLYASADGERKPLMSYSPGDKFLAPKLFAKIGDAMRAAERAGSPPPEFKVVSETRAADEGGRFVMFAEMQELDPMSGAPIGGKYNTLADLYEARDAIPAKQPETPEEKTEREAREKSAALSV